MLKAQAAEMGQQWVLSFVHLLALCIFIVGGLYDYYACFQLSLGQRPLRISSQA